MTSQNLHPPPDIYRHLDTLSILSALPASVLAELITRTPKESPFDDNSLPRKR